MKSPSAFVTRSGLWFDPGNPRVEDVRVEDVAHALACMPRFGAQIPRPYSVAQHSVLVSRVVPPALAMQGLLHDAHEAYVLDMPAPVKKLLPDYRAMEARCARVVRLALGVPSDLAPEIKVADKRMCATEARAFGLPWWADTDQALGEPYPEIDPFPSCWSWQVSEEQFISRFWELSRRAARA